MQVIASYLETLGICGKRIRPRANGYRVAQSALQSTHPNAAAAKAGFGWAELFFRDEYGGVFPQREDYYAPVLPPPQSNAYLPIFYMRPGVAVGEYVMLHFFEPRYQLLIRRAWAGDKTFIYCADAPFSAEGRAFNLPLDREPSVGTCAVVLVDTADFREDGTLTIALYLYLFLYK